MPNSIGEDPHGIRVAPASLHRPALPRHRRSGPARGIRGRPVRGRHPLDELRHSAHQGNDYASATYGYGYAFARDNICLLAEEFNKVNGERALHFGAGGSYDYRANGSGNVNNLSSDFFYELVMDEAIADAAG